MYISKVEYRTSPEPCGKEFTDKGRCNDSRFCTSSEFQICLGPIRGQNVGSIVASRSKTSKQNLTIVAVAVTVAVSVTESISVGPVAETVVSSVVVGISLSLSIPLAVVAVGPVAQTVVAKTVVAKTIAVAVVGIGISLRLGSGEGRKGKCQDSLHLSSATFCDKPSPCTLR